MKLHCIRALAIAAFAAASTFATAQLPDKPIRVFMPGAPGGSFDIMTRMVMNALSDQIGKAVVVENFKGAGGMVSIERCLQEPADGSNLCVGYVGSLAIAPYLYPDTIKYDPVKDLKPVALLGSVSFVLAVPASSQFKTAKELFAFAKANPGKLNYASSGNGTGAHVGGEIVKRQAKLDMVHVPYQGNAPAAVALLGGHVHWSFEALPTSLPNVKAGKLRALAVTSPQRLDDLPDVPTMQEIGFPDFDLSSWLAVSVRKDTPDAAVSYLNAEINKVLASPPLKEGFGKRGAKALGGTPEQFAKHLGNELVVYKSVMGKAKAD